MVNMASGIARGRVISPLTVAAAAVAAKEVSHHDSRHVCFHIIMQTWHVISEEAKKNFYRQFRPVSYYV